MLDFYGALSGMDAPARKRRIGELLELVGLGDWGDVRLGKYSKGMLQRVGLAQSLMHEPRLLILDEPSDGVDPVGRRQIRDILNALEQRGVTIFVNSHLLAEVEAFCRDVAILHKGKVVLQGKVKDLTAGKGYRLTVPAEIPEQVRNELATRAGSIAVRDGVLDMQFADRAAVNGAIDVLRSQQLEIEAVTPTTSTLEDVFIRSVNG
jgi:ABC-2 type transport system ATP-binding protein